MSSQQGNHSEESDKWGKRRKKRKKGKYRLEYRIPPDEKRGFLSQFPQWHIWRTYHKSYTTIRDRDQALKDFKQKCHTFEYRIKEDV